MSDDLVKFSVFFLLSFEPFFFEKERSVKIALGVIVHDELVERAHILKEF